MKYIFSSRPVLFLFLLFCSCFAGAQTVTTLPKGLDWTKVETEFYKQLNQLRQEKGLSPLTKDVILNKAAYDQSAYMLEIHQLSHTQKVKGKETPYKRVVFYGGTHDGVGENCINVSLFTPMQVKYSKTPITVADEKAIATALFLGWKNSPGHYKNMITDYYDVAGLGFAVDKTTNMVCCAQVFAQKPYIAPKGLVSPLDAYGVKDYEESVCKCMKSPEWAELSGDLRLMIGKDSIYIMSEKLAKLKKFFNDPQDAFYLDFVLRDQFVCEKNNLLHGSPIYDGYMMKPVLLKDLFKKNQAKDGLNFYAALGPVPPAVAKYKYAVNFGVIKKGYGCSYNWGAPVPQEDLESLTLIPKWVDDPDLKIRPDTFKGVLTFDVPFERNKTEVPAASQKEIQQRLSVYKPFMKSVSLKTFSSVEGNSAANVQLQNKRAAAIRQLVDAVNPGAALSVTIESSENWEAFFAQIENTHFDYLRHLDQATIKQRLQNKELLDSLEIILRSTRIARLEVEIETVVTNESDPYIMLGAYQKALQMGDSLQAFACQSRLITYLRQYKLKNSDITAIPIPENKKFLAHLTNWVGLATNDPDLFYRRETRERAIRYIHLDTNFLPLQFNYCIMALQYMRQLGDTILLIPQLETKMQKCYKLRTTDDSTSVDYMLLNFNIMTAYNHYHRFEFHKVEKPLRAIRDYFQRYELTESEAIKLGLLFNLYGRSAWTISMLQPLLKKYNYNDDLLFLFVETYVAIDANTMPFADYKELLTTVRKRDPVRFDTWIDKGCFQLLRKPEIKEQYCKMKKT